jgi:hypothetical protein|nr:MAG TPA: hypothetical protein [Caudoviricetes sp.]
MKEKTQYEALVEELQKIGENFKVGFTEIGEILSKILPDVEIPDEEEDTWEMKCPYKYGGYHWVVYDDGEIGGEKWVDSLEDDGRFLQGNIFQTEQAAELESKRRNLLTRFRAFRDECNNGWKPDWESENERKYYLMLQKGEFLTFCYWVENKFNLFGYFKNEEDAERAIELFGDEIKELFVEV